MLLRTVKKHGVIFIGEWEMRVLACPNGDAIVTYRGDTLRLSPDTWTTVGVETHVTVSRDREPNENEVRLAFDAPRHIRIFQPGESDVDH